MPRILVYTIFLLVVCTACEDPLNLWLPDKTTEGLNTLGFVTGDCVWTNYGRRCTEKGCVENLVKGNLYKTLDKPFEFIVTAGFSVPDRSIDQVFALHANGISSTGTFPLAVEDGEQLVWIANTNEKYFRQYALNGVSKAELVITRYDTLLNVISGEFRGVLYNPVDSTDYVTIDEGRFDVAINYTR